MPYSLAHRQDTCPAGHPLPSPHTLRCPTCGRLLPLRFARVCPNGHVVAGPLRVCPHCGETPASPRLFRMLALGAVGAFVLYVIVVLAADVPQRLIDGVLNAYQAALSLIKELPFFG